MCGICGRLSKDSKSVTEELLRRMCQTISYRGPDDDGIWITIKPEFGAVGLGHQRLSIIDLSDAGRQPITNEDKSLWLVFNGEIYNFLTLRKSLERNGHRFFSNTDSEVILHQYEQDGIGCVEKFNGMFAFGLWDDRKNRLILCRDRLGIKPVVYYWDGCNLIFASEIKAILTDPSVTREINWTALGLYLNASYIPAPWTIFKNIYKLKPGHYLVFENGHITIHQYWDINNSSDMPRSHLSFEEQKKHLFELLNESVKRRLISDVPLGAFLSGGTDSSIIVALMASHMLKPVKTFSIGYRDLPLYDETDYAKATARLYKTEHHEFKLSYKDIIEIVPGVLDSLDEPFSDSSVFPTFIVSKMTGQHVTVALAGDGADELFAGYRKYTGEYWYRYYSILPYFFRNNILQPLADWLPDSRDTFLNERFRRIKKFINGAGNSLTHRVQAWREIFPEELCQKILKPHILSKIQFKTFEENISYYLERYSGDPVNKMLYLDTKDSLPDDMLNKVDRMSMLNSLEVRVPFLDHELVEFAFQIGGDKKLYRGSRKYVLLETFKKLLPREIRIRPKWGFEVPISTWLRNELRFLIDDYLSDSIIKKQGIFNSEAIDDLVQKYLHNKTDTSWQLWNLIVFGHWYQRYFS